MSRLEIISRFFLALASTMLLLIGGVAFPPAGVMLVPLVPQPVLSFGLKFGKAWSATLLLSATVLLLIVAGIEMALVYSLFALMVVLLYLLASPSRSIESVVVGTTAVMFGTLAVFAFSAYGSWSELVQHMRAGLEENLALSLGLYEKMGLSKESLELLQERTPLIINTILQILPALVFISLGLMVLVNVFLLWRRFPERRAAWLSTENLREWKGPEFLVWCLIISGICLLLPDVEVLKFFALNLLLITVVFYFFQGLAIVAFYFHKKNVPLFLRGLTYILIVFEQIFTLFVVGLGLFDLWGDFRRLKNKDLNPSQVS
jgi:uncharacterized protein YybS (DUF2232 family)